MPLSHSELTFIDLKSDERKRLADEADAQEDGVVQAWTSIRHPFPSLDIVSIVPVTIETPGLLPVQTE